MLNPKIIPLFKKQEYLKTLTEDDFGDKIVRPLYLQLGLKHGKDICGPDEDGKDCYMWGEDVIRGRVLYLVQTKRGDLKMSSKASDNVTNVTAQLRTALETPVKDSSTRQTVYADYVILAASGEINKKAQGFITDQIKDKRLLFRGSDELIPEIDMHIPEVWFGIDTKRLPYLKRLREYLINQSDTIDVSQLSPGGAGVAPITDDAFIQLYLQRYKTKIVRVRGKVESELELEEIVVQDALKRNERVLLVTGDAGSGKTTSLRRLAMILVQNALQSPKPAPIPVFLTASEIADKPIRLVELAANVTQQLTMEDGPAFSLDDLASGNVVLLIDALDEVATTAGREVVSIRIDEFIREYSNCRLILTSRDNPSVRDAVRHLPFTRFSISPINFGQATKIIERLSRGKSLAPETTNEILRRLENIHGMELNPLLVTVFVATTDYARTDIPANITELFKKFTELMLGRWDQSKGLSQQYQAQVKDFLLCRIGFTLHQRRHTSMPLIECRSIVEQDLMERGLEADVEVLFDEIVHRSGLVRVDDDRFYFRHLLIQEFFAGRGIPSLDFLGSAASDYWWMRAIIFYFGERPGDSNALAHVQHGLSGLDGTDLHQAAVTLGLAVQACYLTKTQDKKDAMEWVVASMAHTLDACINFFGTSRGKHDVVRFILYYLYGRDAVAAKVIGEVATQILASNTHQASGKDFKDLCLFWCIAGLIESRQFNRAEEFLKDFKPDDLRLLLALDIGAFYVEHSHVTSSAQKKAAKAIRLRISPKVPHLRKETLNEFKSLLLEQRADGVRALEGPASDSVETSVDEAEPK